MSVQRIDMKATCSRDTLVKILAAVFLNPGDRDQQGKKIFIQNFLGCGCPDGVVEQAQINFFVNPLGMYLEHKIGELGASPTSTSLEQDVNRLVKLPKALRWPRRTSDELIPPASWRLPMLKAAARAPKDVEKLARLRTMSNATIDAVINVPGRAFFFLVVQEAKKLKQGTLLIQYDSGQLLYKLMGYNRCRLFTITKKEGPKIIPEIDTALTWQQVHSAFLGARDRYAFVDLILDVLE